MDALRSLLDNEKGLFALGLIIAATVLVTLGKMTIDDWKTFATYVFGIYAGATALHGGMVGFRTGGTTQTTPAPTPPSDGAKS